MASIIIFNKPYKVLSQFTDTEGRQNLSSYIRQSGFYPAGRLDYDSEGLLLLTDSGELQHQISHPKHKLPKTYWVQVEGDVTSEAIAQLKKGVILKDGKTKPAKVKQVEEPNIWLRDPPIRFRQHIPTRWLQITITEGRNRQVRRMTAAVGLPTLRLIRWAIGDWTLESTKPGEYQLKTIHLQKQHPKKPHRKQTKHQQFKRK